MNECKRTYSAKMEQSSGAKLGSVDSRMLSDRFFKIKLAGMQWLSKS